jgi:hypothetical protein
MPMPLAADPAAPKPWRRFARLAFWLAAVACAYLLLFGWTAKVTPPDHPEQPVTVLLIFDQMHRGLLLPQGDGYVEYGFLDWNWHARAEDRWYDVFATVLWPTPGALARRLHPAVDAAALRAALPSARLQQLSVGGADVERLRFRLAAQFERGSQAMVLRTGLHMAFVPWDRSYWFADNCSTAVLDWLRELGCSVSWLPLALDLAVRGG